MKIALLLFYIWLPRAVPQGVDCEQAMPLTLDAGPVPVSFADAVHPIDMEAWDEDVAKMDAQLRTCQYAETAAGWNLPLVNPSKWLDIRGTGQGVRLDICAVPTNTTFPLAANVYTAKEDCTELNCVAASNDLWENENCPNGTAGTYLTFSTNQDVLYKVLLAKQSSTADTNDVTIQATTMNFVDTAFCSKATPVSPNEDITDSLFFNQTGQFISKSTCGETHGITDGATESHSQWYVVKGTGKTLQLLEPSCRATQSSVGGFGFYVLEGSCEKSDHQCIAKEEVVNIDSSICPSGYIGTTIAYTWDSKKGKDYYILIQYTNPTDEDQKKFTLLLKSASAVGKSIGLVLVIGTILTLSLSLF